MTVYFLTTDLVFSSRLSGSATRLGMKLKTVSAPAALVEQVVASSELKLVILDLNTQGVEPASLVPALRAAANPPRAIVAYGPHVHENRLTAASAAGCDEVFTRGQFNSRMEEVLAKRSSGELQ